MWDDAFLQMLCRVDQLGGGWPPPLQYLNQIEPAGCIVISMGMVSASEGREERGGVVVLYGGV